MASFIEEGADQDGGIGGMMGHVIEEERASYKPLSAMSHRASCLSTIKPLDVLESECLPTLTVRPVSAD